MKTFVFENNYDTDSARDLAWFTMAESVSVNSGKPFFLPDFDTSFTARPCVAIKFAKLGKSIAREFAPRYYASAAPAFMIFADNLRQSLLSRGLPPDAAMNFDRALQLGDFVELDRCAHPLSMTVKVNGNYQGLWTDALLNIPVDELIEMTSAYNTMKVGDVILSGVPAEGISLKPGMIVEGTLDAGASSTTISFHIK